LQHLALAVERSLETDSAPNSNESTATIDLGYFLVSTNENSGRDFSP
jgi:hypothetical protein